MGRSNWKETPKQAKDLYRSFLSDLAGARADDIGRNLKKITNLKARDKYRDYQNNAIKATEHMMGWPELKKANFVALAEGDQRYYDVQRKRRASSATASSATASRWRKACAQLGRTQYRRRILLPRTSAGYCAPGRTFPRIKSAWSGKHIRFGDSSAPARASAASHQRKKKKKKVAPLSRRALVARATGVPKHIRFF
eukprot:jgi/Mesvir1/19769/Mv13069-RA.1